MKKVLIALIVSSSMSSAFAESAKIYGFYPQTVECYEGRGKASGIAGEGAGEVDVEILFVRGIGGSDAYRNTLCAALKAARKNKTAVDLDVQNTSVRKIEGIKRIQVIRSITLGNALSE